ncbi:PadR family transcriptional regulator [Cellulomonas sp. URHD0024]|uniref:PadR family transcriptional regulator n=1 Tax=Cellulomonas sp. URHD0024 TaxID=1302620 RepID=UPI00040BDB15|nr:PadR family transcriptional regulator [Cellulomonas sp. URHD0024]
MAIGELSAAAVLILALLHEEPMHPYQVHHTLVERGDTRLVRVNAGAVYHGIERLEKEGLVEAAAVERSGNRPERTIYRITDAGRSAFAARLTSFLGDDHPSYPLFPVGLAEAHELASDGVVAELTRRHHRETARMDALRQAHGRLRTLGLPRRYLLDVEHDLAILAAEVAWLDRTLQELRADELEWGRPFPQELAEARAELKACQTPTA